MPNLKGLELLNPLYNYIANKQTLRIMYQSFNAKEANEYILYPYLLKEYRTDGSFRLSEERPGPV